MPTKTFHLTAIGVFWDELFARELNSEWYWLHFRWILLFEDFIWATFQIRRRHFIEHCVCNRLNQKDGFKKCAKYACFWKEISHKKRKRILILNWYYLYLKKWLKTKQCAIEFSYLWRHAHWSCAMWNQSCAFISVANARRVPIVHLKFYVKLIRN